jgi:hypothetical protein
VFSGKDEDFVYFLEQFESRMYMLKLQDALLDKVTVTEEKDGESGDETRIRTAAVKARDELRYRVWCELTQCLDKKTLMLVLTKKPNGTGAWKALVNHFKSTERPRVQKTLAALTSLRMSGGETMAEFLTRAEVMHMDLKDAGEPMSDSMFAAIVLKGLPDHYHSIITMLNYGAEKTYEEMKQTLVNFSNSQQQAPGTQDPPAGTAFSSREGACDNCGRSGHQQQAPGGTALSSGGVDATTAGDRGTTRTSANSRGKRRGAATTADRQATCRENVHDHGSATTVGGTTMLQQTADRRSRAADHLERGILVILLVRVRTVICLASLPSTTTLE